MAAGPGESSQEGETASFRFEMPQSIPAYLFGIAVGNLTFQDLGPRSRIYAEPESVEAAAWEFEGMEERILAAEQLYGPYPWERYDMLLMPPSFPYGGMENPRLNFLTPTLVVGDRSLTSVISHELAHSWTGNLVTNATWDDFWLNEGWTTYAERRIMEITEGSDFSQLAATIGVNNLLAQLDADLIEPEMTRLLTENYDAQVTTWVPYEKGFLFLTVIERAVGRDVFDEFTAKYIAAYKFQSLTTEEFLEFLRAELPQAFELVDIDTWVHGTGLPEDMPRFDSSLMEVVDKASATYQAAGLLPAPDHVADWKATQVELFLQGLPQSIPVDDCKRVEKLFGFGESHNYQLLTYFYLLSIRSGYQDVLPGIETELSVVGRGLFTNEIYRVLAGEAWSKQIAREYYERYKSRYHPIVSKRIGDILAEAGV